jgi:hypothetical protein
LAEFLLAAEIVLGSFTDHFDGLPTSHPNGSFPDGAPSDQIAGRSDGDCY